MIVTQRPRTMGSTQPPDVDLPFGYTFDAADLFLAEPPEPPPGQPILSDNEQKLLSNFFHDVNSENYNNVSLGDGLNFSEDWLNLPPNFMAVTTSLGYQRGGHLESYMHESSPSGPFHDLVASNSSHMPPPPLPSHPNTTPSITHSTFEQHASAEVLAAATVLQNGSLPRAGSSSIGSAFSSRSGGSATGSQLTHLRHQSMVEFRPDGHPVSQSHTSDHASTFSHLSADRSPNPQVASRNPPIEVQWGSDSNFGRHFIPQSEKETSEALEKERLIYMNCLEVNSSAANTRPSSPVYNGDLSPLKLKTRSTGQAAPEPERDEGHTPPRKRRKSRPRADSEDAEEETTSSTSRQIRRRRAKGADTTATSPPADSSSGKRRKSAGANGNSKPTRENLTEEQKRENHIRSEQKRRTLIKEGFDDLCDLVPGLKGGGFSKSSMLTMAAEWLDELLRGNQQLQAQLAGLESR
ncbi:hypothetical protein VTK73DRAFT_4796 [Phialemonium thermophilum]|uniref:BHLH domain-containing protein n=1 Tax=Phialemonium thermophilum TaxID=223376 RepID=A0ABR3Y053_9PEZI